MAPGTYVGAFARVNRHLRDEARRDLTFQREGARGAVRPFQTPPSPPA